jgi:hypothetical protein
MLIAASSVLALGACASVERDTHRHGPRGAPMQDAAMPERPDECPHEGASHDMNRPHDTGPMPNAAHPGCAPDDQARSSEQPAPQR